MNRTLLALLIAVAPAVLMAQLPEYVPTENLVGWYPFDGDAENFGGTSSDGTVYGATAAVNRFDDFNSALSFDGSNDYVEIPHSEDLLIGGGSATWACWCKIPSVSHGSQSPLITNYVTPTTPLFGLYVGGVNEGDYEGRVQIHYRTNSAGSEVGCQSDFRVDDSSWHHIAGVLDADQDSLQLYIDGILTATRYALAGSPDSYQSIVLGGNHLGRFFEVTIDEVGIWNRALHHDEIENLYESALVNCIPAIELSDVSVLSTPTSRYAEDGVLAISVSTGQPASLSIVNLGDSTTEVIPFTTTVPEVGAGIYAVSVQDSDGCSSDTLTVMLPYELCCECGVGDVDTDGICDDEDNCTDPSASNYRDTLNGYCAWPHLNCSPIDFDGWTYRVVPIGDQCWFADNLRTSIMSNGDLIAGHSHNEYSHTSNDTWVNSDHPLRATAFDALPSPETNCTHMPEFVGIPFLCDSNSLKNHIGYLYNGYSVIDSRGLCPTGWRVPSDNDWQELELFIGMPNAEVDLNVAYRGSTMQVALHLFEEVSPAWLSPNSAWHGFGTTGFDALRGGHIEGWSGRSSGHLGISFWTSSTLPVQETEIIPAPLEFGTINRLFYRSMSNRNLNQGIFRSAIPKSSGAYVRCIKN